MSPVDITLLTISVVTLILLCGMFSYAHTESRRRAHETATILMYAQEVAREYCAGLAHSHQIMLETFRDYKECDEIDREERGDELDDESWRQSDED